MLLIAHLCLVARLNVYLLEGVQAISRLLDLTVDQGYLVLDRLALGLVCVICETPLVNLVAVVDDLRKRQYRVSHDERRHLPES